MARQKSISKGGNKAAETGAVQLPAADEEFWRRTEAYMPKTKQGVFIRLDADVLAWLKAKGKGYQTRMNAMLRVLMETDPATPRVLAGSDGTAAGLTSKSADAGLVLLDAGAAVPVIEISKLARPKKPQVA